MSKIAIIIPTYNELENVEILIKNIKKYLPRSDIYIIDDSKKPDIKFLIRKKKIKN